MSNEKRLRSILGLRDAWRDTLRGEDGELTQAARTMLVDLQRFCCANRSTIRIAPQTGAIDPLAMAVSEGRREVWLRIADALKLDDRDLQTLLKQHNDEVFN